MFVRISQALPDVQPRTLTNIKKAANDLFHENTVSRYLYESEVKPKCLKGTAVYLVNKDDTLKLLESDWDTSD
jgi:hypothetical protein